MKKQFVFISSLAIFAAGALMMSLTSCSKTSTPNPNAQFVGTYGGQSNYGNTSNQDILIITAGSTPSAITIVETLDNTTYTATVSGDSIIIPAQTVTLINNGNVGVSLIGGSGLLAGSNLSMGAAGTYNNVSKANFTFSFQGKN